MKFRLTSIILICCLGGFAQAQSNINSIKVTGAASVNVSPNEIIIEIRYQEYFEGEEQESNRVSIESIEALVLQALGNAAIQDEKITLGGINVVRPSYYKNGDRIFLKRRLSKALYICVETTDQLLKVVRELGKAQLMDDIITEFQITETRHTDIEQFEKEVKVEAFKDAREKAELILSTSNQKAGKVLSIKEFDPRQPALPQAFDASTYETVAVPSAQVSGFRPIVVGYQIEVVFEIE